MKVALEQDYRRIYTLEELDAAKVVIACQKDDCTPLKDLAITAVNHISARKYRDLGGCKELLKVEAYTAKNSNVWEQYGEGSMYFDVWVEFVAETYTGFIKGGAYLSDIWGIGSDTDFTGRMYFKLYAPQ